MMKEENILMNKFGKGNHFSVPKGYFDSFADHLMEQLPDSSSQVIDIHAQSWWSRFPLRKVVAVMGIGVVLAVGAVGVTKKMSSHAVMMVSANADTTHEGNPEYSSFDQMADYTMMDNQDIYATLVAEN